MHHKYWVIAGTPLRYPAVSQSQGDPEARHDIWGQVSLELYAAAHLPAFDVGLPNALQALWGLPLCL